MRDHYDSISYATGAAAERLRLHRIAREAMVAWHRRTTAARKAANLVDARCPECGGWFSGKSGTVARCPTCDAALAIGSVVRPTWKNADGTVSVDCWCDEGLFTAPDEPLVTCPECGSLYATGALVSGPARAPEYLE